MRKKQLVLAVALLLAVVSLAAAAAPDAYSLARTVIGGGGGHAAGGAFTLDGTIGQGVAGWTTGGVYEVCAGFWCGAGRYSFYLPLALRG